MLGLLIASAFFGGVAAALTGTGVLFWVVGGVVFVCGLPFALVSSFIHGEVSYAQDRADWRETMAEIAADERAERYTKPSKKAVYNDNRQVHVHGARI